MHLVHLRLRSAPGPGIPLPEQTGDWLRAAALPGDRFEHVSVHPYARPDPVLGVYVLADLPQDALEQVQAACLRTLRGHGELCGWSLVEVKAALPVPPP
jgi:hypothetical protein